MLRNDHGKFTDATVEIAPDLERPGLVTSAIWSDLDNDGWVDLLVTCEWGPIRYYHNESGRLAERTGEAGLADRSGWWNGIAAGDVDDDGDIDFVVTNRGLNTRYQPSRSEPCRLYYGDFDGRGAPQLIEATVTSAGLLPVRGRSALEGAMPGLLQRFPSHHSFAGVTLPDIVGTDVLDAAYHVEANTAESGVLLNDGKGHLTFQALPRMAQIAPGFGLALADVDGDGRLDLCIVQNFFGPAPEHGRMDGGVSLLLLGQGDGTFERFGPIVAAWCWLGKQKSHVGRSEWRRLGGFRSWVNDGELAAFENGGSKVNRMFGLNLQGKPGNLRAAGAHITLDLDDGTMRTAEVYAGGGYLSQATGILSFGLGESRQVKQVIVRWPDGKTTRQVQALGGNRAVLAWGLNTAGQTTAPTGRSDATSPDP